MTSTEVVDASGDAEPSAGKKRVRIAIPTTHRQHRAELVFMALVKPHRDVDEPGNAEPESGSKRSKGGPLDMQKSAPSYRQSPQYWYPGGSVIVVTGGMGFKLYHGRLKAHCGYFAERASTRRDHATGACEHEDSDDDDDSHAEEHTTVSRANAPRPTQVHIDDLSSTDFTRFLDVLETPQ